MINSAKRSRVSIFDIFIYFFMTFTAVITIYPFLNVIAISFNDSIDTLRGGIHILPRQFTLRNYQEVIRYDNLLTAAKNSVLRTVIGTVLTVFCSSMLAYTLSRKDFFARKLFSTIFALTMYFSGGMIPVYMLMRNLHLTGSFMVYLLPALIGVWNVFVIRSYIDGLPYSLQESAKLDGASDFFIFIKIILPLSTPVLATIALFVAVAQWNSWFDTYLYNSSRKELSTLQYELMKILTNTESQSSVEKIKNSGGLQVRSMVSPESIRMAITVVVVTPILIVYPFLQKYFIKGVTLGAVKG